MDNTQNQGSFCTDISLNHDQLELYNVITRLWMEHALWSRAFIKSSINALGDLEEVTKRLLRNPVDFADVLVQFYGDENATVFEEDLSEHLLLASDIVTALMDNDANVFEEKESAWYANADKIAVFLGEINPEWDEEVWKNMLYEHLDMIENQIILMLNGNYADSIAQYDYIQDAILIMADYMACGLINQFLM